MKIELNIPTTLSEIPLVNYQKFLKMYEDSTDEEFINQKMIEIFCGVELKDVVKIKLTDVNEIQVNLNKIFSEKPKFKHRFKIGEIEYGFIPKLEDITLEEFTNLSELMKSWDTFHLAMAVMFRPITLKVKDKYEIMPYSYSDDMGEAFKFCSLDICIPARVFFWTLSKELLSAIPSFLEKEMKKNPNLAKEFNLANNGGGMDSIINSLTENLKVFQELEHENYLKLSRS